MYMHMYIKCTCILKNNSLVNDRISYFKLIEKKSGNGRVR